MQSGQAINNLKKTLDVIKNKQPIKLDIYGKLVRTPKEGRAIVIGDLHGDLSSLNNILAESRFIERVENDEKVYLVFLGDYIDRGPEQLEVLLRASELVSRYPSSVIMLRGNHEGPEDVIARPHDFPRQLREKTERGDDIYSAFRGLIDELFTAVLFPRIAFLAHGGIPTNTKKLEKIANAHINHPDDPTLVELLWNDPGSGKGIKPSYRGAGHYFGEDVLREFLKEHKLDWLIRGHESAFEGYRIEGKALTLFSCKLPHYGNRMASYLEIPLDRRINDIESFVHQF
jgi:protein phosphatase